MNTYCAGLNLKIPLFKEGITLNDFPKIRHSKIDIEKTVNTQLLELLHLKNLYIYFGELFYATPFYTGGIHSDYAGLSNDVVKINWIFGGSNSIMHWYLPINAGILKTTAIDSKYMLYSRDQVKLIYSKTLATPSLVQTGIPHNVSNHKEDRYCFTFIIADCTTQKPISMNHALELFSEYV